MKDTLNRVISVIAQTLRVSEKDLSLEVGVGDLPDWDSLGHINVISAIEEDFAVIFEIEEALDCETIQDIVEILEEKK
jgi:acyl carrier protein